MIELPARLQQKLLSETPYPILHGAIVQGLSQLQSWFDENGPRMVFFPDYTDHGPKHLRAILELADFLIADGSSGRPDSWAEITPRDAAVLIWAILVHDLGMHLTEAAFVALVEDPEPLIRVPSLDQHTWSDLWTTFLADAGRWDGRTRIKVTGEVEPESALLNSKSSRCAPEGWKPADFRIIGEFIRRNHPRLAHEIAICGWPASIGSPIPSGGAVFTQNPELADLAGLVARSHGHNIRDLLPYLKSRHYNVVETRGVHPVFLMGVLRIADFLHLHAERASQSTRGLRKLSSPVSRREWDAHAAIYDVRLDTETDPEAIAVDVSPGSLAGISAYLRVREWLRDLQAEIDQTWVVLGEVYGRNERLQKLWLSVRRVNSNFHDESFGRALSFVPIEARFAAAGADLLKLLIFPLYGDEPGIGGRELIQNAVDAVRERAFFEAGASVASPMSWPALDPQYPSADVLVRLGTHEHIDLPPERGGPPRHWEKWIEVSDRGSGMSLSVLTNYYLKAGASFRMSDAWKDSYEDTSPDEDHPHSKVLRSGRFGIGALAAFLLGDEIHVSTRYINDAEGYAFSAELETEEIQVSRVRRGVGTSIFVRINDESVFYRADETYRLRWPAVVTVRGDGGDALRRRLLPAAGAELPASWHRIYPKNYQEVQWTYASVPELVCNGIVVGEQGVDLRWPDRGENLGWAPREAEMTLSVPNLSVFDPDGRLPLNLARTNTTTRSLPFFTELLNDVVKDYLAFALLYAPAAPLRGRTFPSYSRIRYPGFSTTLLGHYWRPGAVRTVRFMPWVAMSDGVCIPDAHLITWAGITTLIGLIRRRKARWVPGFRIPPGHAVIGFDSDGDDAVAERIWPLAEPDFFPRDHNPLSQLSITWGRALLDHEVAAAIEGTRWVADSGTDVRTTQPIGTLALLESEWIEPGSSLLNDLLAYKPLQRNSSEACFILEWRVSPVREIGPSRISELWKQIIGQPTIPYETKARRKLIDSTRHELGGYLDKWAERRSTDSWLSEHLGSNVKDTRTE